MNIHGGIGVPLSGIGLSGELRNHRVGFYGSSGYLYPIKTEQHTVSQSFNFGAGTYFYFNKIARNWQPKVGLHAGWLNNYYDERIGTESYKASVYGLSFLGAFEFHSNWMYLNLGLCVDPGNMLFEKEKHPYYNSGQKLFISPFVSIGTSMGDLVQKNKQKHNKKYQKKTKTQNAFIRQVKRNQNVFQKTLYLFASKERKTYQRSITEECISSESEYIITNKNQGACGNIQLYQQIVADRYLFVFLNLDTIEAKPECTSYDVNKNLQNIRIYLLDVEQMSDSICCTCNYHELQNINDSEKPLKYYATEGKISISTSRTAISLNNQKPYRVAVKLTDIKFERVLNQEHETIFLDEVIIYDVLNKRFCDSLN